MMIISAEEYRFTYLRNHTKPNLNLFRAENIGDF